MSDHETEIDKLYQDSVPYLLDEYRVHKDATVSTLIDLGLEPFKVIQCQVISYFVPIQSKDMQCHTYGPMFSIIITDCLLMSVSRDKLQFFSILFQCPYFEQDGIRGDQMILIFSHFIWQKEVAITNYLRTSLLSRLHYFHHVSEKYLEQCQISHEDLH